VDKDWWWFTEDLRAMYDLEEIKCHNKMFEGCWAHFEDGIYWNPNEMIYPRAYRKREVTITSEPKKIELKSIRFLCKLTLAPSDSGSEVIIEDCPWLDEVTLPAKGVVALKIKNCPELKKISIPEGCLVRLEVANCQTLSEVCQQDSTFDHLTIDGCHGIEELVCPKGLASLDITHASALTNIVVRSGLDTVRIYDTPALRGINGSSCFVFPKGTKSISVGPGSQNTQEHQVIIFPGVVSARYFIANLTGVELKEGITSLGGNAVRFGSLSSGYGLKSGRLVLPASLKEVGQNNFDDVNLTKCTIIYPSLETATLGVGLLKNHRSKVWESQGRCKECGGRIKGFREKKCANCGRRAW